MSADGAGAYVKDAWTGRSARIMPSGHIHLIEYVRHRGEDSDRDLCFFACGKEARRSYLTLRFPPEGRRCPRCSPPPKPDPVAS